jgi:1,4-dihydroxy-2-naphthoyl-CoA synthase
VIYGTALQSGAICSHRVPFVSSPPFAHHALHKIAHEKAPGWAYDTVLYTVSDRICTITLNHPEKLNAWTTQMHFDLKDAMHAAGADPEVRAIVLTVPAAGSAPEQT